MMHPSLSDVELPPIFCPLESAIHPRVRKVEALAEEWVAGSGMCADESDRAAAVASYSTDFFARFAPGATETGLLAASLWVYWGFAFDDARCDAGPLSEQPGLFNALAGRMQRALEAPSFADPDRFAAPLQDIAARLRACGAAVQVRRFAAAHRAWLAGVAWQIGNVAQGRVPDLDEYLAMRLLSSGGEPTFALLELATGVHVPGEEFDRPAVRALTEMAICVAALDNDRHSLSKELVKEHTEQNIHTVLMAHRGLDLQDAVTTAAGLRDRVLLRFLELHGQVAPRASAELRGYLQGLRHGIRGNAEWGLRVPRYLSKGGVPGGMDDTPLRWAQRPTEEAKGPLPAPSVAWWWDEDLTA